MDNEKILFCYRDDKQRKPIVFGSTDDIKTVAAVPCIRRIWKKRISIKQKWLKKDIARLYERSKAGYLWLDDALCDFLGMERMDLPGSLIANWLSKIPFFHTLIFADDEKGSALEYILTKTDKVAAICVVCYENNVSAYEELAKKIFQREGIVLQVFTYEVLGEKLIPFGEKAILKGRSAVLDFDRKRSFWDKRLSDDIGYYSFWHQIRLFLDTFQKNGYNTLTK